MMEMQWRHTVKRLLVSVLGDGPEFYGCCSRGQQWLASINCSGLRKCRLLHQKIQQYKANKNKTCKPIKDFSTGMVTYLNDSFVQCGDCSPVESGAL